MSGSFSSNGFSSDLENALSKAKSLMQIYSLSQQMRPMILEATFGRDINIQELRQLIKQFKEEVSLTFPEVETRSRLTLQGARSLYVPELDVIYLAEDFVKEADRDELQGYFILGKEGSQSLE